MSDERTDLIVDLLQEVREDQKTHSEILSGLQQDVAINTQDLTEHKEGVIQNRTRIEKSNVLLVQKDAAIIKGQQQVEQAKLAAEKETVERQKVADLAIIDKSTQLQQAKANEGIQKANAVAARYEASAIKEKGFAEAAVDRAKLRAKQDNKTIYLAELALEEAKAIANVLPHVKVNMPSIIMNGGSGSGSQVSDLLSTKLVQDVIQSTKKTKIAK